MPAKRRTIFDLVYERLQTILTSNGYTTNLGNAVKIWRDMDANPPNESELPMMTVGDLSHRAEQEVSQIHEHVITFIVEILYQGGANTYENLQNAIEDVYKAVGTDRQWTANARDTQWIRDQSGIVHGINKTMGARCEFEISYITTEFSPT